MRVVILCTHFLMIFSLSLVSVKVVNGERQRGKKVINEKESKEIKKPRNDLEEYINWINTSKPFRGEFTLKYSSDSKIGGDLIFYKIVNLRVWDEYLYFKDRRIESRRPRVTWSEIKVIDDCAEEGVVYLHTGEYSTDNLMITNVRFSEEEVITFTLSKYGRANFQIIARIKEGRIVDVEGAGLEWDSYAKKNINIKLKRIKGNIELRCNKIY